MLEAITLFNQKRWNTDDQPGRFTLTDKALLDRQISTNQVDVHAIIYSLPSINLVYLQQYYPELLI